MTSMKRRSFIAGLATAPFALQMMSDGGSLGSTSRAQRASTDPFNLAHSTPTTELNTATATAIISLRGLGMGCFGTYGYESGFVPNPDHQYFLQIKEIGLGANPLIRPPVRINSNIRFEVINPVRRGVFRYETGSTFRRPHGSMDERHFRWILELEDSLMHGEKLDFIPLSQGARPLRRVVIPHATFYTRSLSDYVYARVNARDHAKDAGIPIGRLAQEIGAAIECQPRAGSGIRITVQGGTPLFLPRKDGHKYEISLRNLRPDHVAHYDSDFPLYYEVLRDPDGDQFNLAHVIAVRSPSDKSALPDGSLFIQRAGDFDLYRRGCCGLACDKVILSGASSLDQPPNTV